MCTTKDSETENEAKISDARKALETDLTAKVTGASVGIESGYRRKVGSERVENQKEAAESSRMTLETQGGNGLLASR